MTKLDVLDCGDNSCMFDGRDKGGVRTNGGCRCLTGLSWAQRARVLQYVRRMSEKSNVLQNASGTKEDETS
jgi:hypothetical protein